MLEEEQHRRMVAAYRNEIHNMSEWLGQKKLQRPLSAASTSSNQAIQNQLKQCKDTVADIERKLKQLAELSSE